MAMTHQRADVALNALDAAHVWLHTGSPGEAGTANVAQTSVPANIVKKSITFAAVGNHATNTERRRLSSSAAEWSGAEIAASQTITHFSIWNHLTTGDPFFMGTVAVDKTTGSDGVIIASGDIEVAISVFVKP